MSQASPQTEAWANLTQGIPVAAYPLPDWRNAPSDEGTAPSVERQATFRFVDVAEKTGLRFQYYNDHNPQVTVMRTIEATGGGAGVLDYDVDGWPDIHLTQGCIWPPGSQHGPRHVDRFFRNQGDGTFGDVTKLAGLTEAGYSQGLVVGDYNNDGFPDVYVANFGPNCFYENNGDGTFRDVTPRTGTAGADWTASCALADLNGDALPDLYVVNYLGGADVDSRICKDNSGARGRACRTCFPGAGSGVP